MDKKLVQYIAKLSSFNLTEEEVERYTYEISNIFEILDVVKNFNNKDIEPMISPVSSTLKLSEDIIQDQDNRSSFSKFACDVEDDYFMVPQVI